MDTTERALAAFNRDRRKVQRGAAALEAATRAALRAAQRAVTAMEAGEHAARAALRSAAGAGRPEDVWAEYRQEIGPLEKASYDDVQEVLDTQLFAAWVLGESVLLIPRVIAEHMVSHLEAWRDGRAIRSRGRPRKSWRHLRFQALAVAQVKARAVEFTGEGVERGEAWELALATVAGPSPISVETLRRWTEGRARSARK